MTSHFTWRVLVVAASLAAPAAQQVSPPLAITDVTVIDGTGRPASPGMTVIVQSGRITRIERAGASVPAGAQVIDGRGKFLIPGLIDVHVHLRGGGSRASEQPITAAQEQDGVRALHTFLYAGVTTIFDAGNQGSFIFALREKARTGAIVSPRIFATGGTVTSPGGHGEPVGDIEHEMREDRFVRAVVHVVGIHELLARIIERERGKVGDEAQERDADDLVVDRLAIVVEAANRPIHPI